MSYQRNLTYCKVLFISTILFFSMSNPSIAYRLIQESRSGKLSVGCGSEYESTYWTNDYEYLEIDCDSALVQLSLDLDFSNNILSINSSTYANYVGHGDDWNDFFARIGSYFDNIYGTWRLECEEGETSTARVYIAYNLSWEPESDVNFRVAGHYYTTRYDSQYRWSHIFNINAADTVINEDEFYVGYLKDGEKLYFSTFLYDQLCDSFIRYPSGPIETHAELELTIRFEDASDYIPVADFTCSNYGCNYVVTNFNNTTSGNGYISCYWDLGNGYTSTEWEPCEMVYPPDPWQPEYCDQDYLYFVGNNCIRDYIVSLTVENEFGSNTCQKVIRVEKRPEVTIEYGYPDPNDLTVVQFYGHVDYNDVSCTTESWEWDFGPVGNSNQQDVQIQFPDGCEGWYDVSLTATNGICSDTDVTSVHIVPNVQKPKALLMHGYVDDPGYESTWGMYLDSAESNLKDNMGWDASQVPNIDELIATAFNDPSVRGIIINSHGVDRGCCEENPSNMPLVLEDQYGNIVYITPQELATYIRPYQLDFITVIACNQVRSEWEKWFPDTHIILAYSPDLYGSVWSATELVAELNEHHGSNVPACSSPSLQSSIIRQNDFSLHIESSASGCLSFGVCDTLGNCGESLYPVHTCAESTGVTTDGAFTVTPDDGSYLVTCNIDESSPDTLSLFTTYFENVPFVLNSPHGIPIGRYLYFQEYMRNSLSTVDDYSIVLYYTEEDLISAGEVSEFNLGVFWLTDDQEGFHYVESVFDYDNNSCTFSTPAWGIVGIYDLTGVVATTLQEQSSRYTDGGILINWTTSEPVVTDRFVVYRKSSSTGEYSDPGLPIHTSDYLHFSIVDKGIEPGNTYTYRVELLEDENSRTLFITESLLVPSLSLAMEQNYPNPFNPVTTIKYYLPQRCQVTLDVYDIAGRHVASLVGETQDKGYQTIEWNGVTNQGNRANTGTYFYKLVAGKETISKKMVIIR